VAVIADRLRARLEARNWQRAHCALIVTVAAASAFLVSRLLIALHVWSMPWRYGVAALAGYGAFLLMIRLWVTWKCSRLERDDDPRAARLRSDGGSDFGSVFDDLPIPSRSGGGGRVAVDAFGGGRSGGGGASMAFGPSSNVSTASVAKVGGGSSKGSGIGLDVDGDDLFWILVALAAVFAGVAAVSYVVWLAPSLLGEAALNAVVAGKVYQGMQRRDASHWTEDQFKRTIVPAVIIFASAVVAGYAFHRIAPEAISIGGVREHIIAGRAR